MAKRHERLGRWAAGREPKYGEMLRETKAAAAAMGRLMPLDIQLQAAKLVKADDDELQEDEDSDEEVRDAAGVGDQAFRRNAP